MNAPLRRLAAVVALLFALLFASDTYVQYVSAATLNARPGNVRTLYKSFGRERQPLILANEQIATSVKSGDSYGYLRKYPQGPLYAPVTGYYSIVYGTSGMEAAEGDVLSGTSDQFFYRRIQDLLTGKPAQGATVELTIQAKAQRAAFAALGSQRGSVVALDPKTGNILAMVSTPSFDPNKLAAHDTAAVQAAWKAYLADDGRPLENRAISGQMYPPGSTFKLVTAAAALESGQYQPDTMVDGPATLALPQTNVGLPNDFPGACGPDGKISLIDALKISCNTAFGSIGMQLGDQALRSQAQKFGFGQALKVPLTVSPSTFPAQLDQAQTAQSAIGQFDVRVTPLQMAMVSAAIANGGKLMKPNLVNRILSPDLSVLDRPEPQTLGEAVSSDTAQKLKQMMEAVVNSPGGTGSNAASSAYVVAGKTGTAENGTPEAKKPPYAWFTAFAPADDPQVAVAVVVEDGGTLGDAASGGRVAAPIAKQVMEAVIGR